ncbi:MAG: hypothetical protein QXQ61_03020 [Candidatus Bathyarchaeia archaeon]
MATEEKEQLKSELLELTKIFGIYCQNFKHYRAIDNIVYGHISQSLQQNISVFQRLEALYLATIRISANAIQTKAIKDLFKDIKKAWTLFYKYRTRYLSEYDKGINAYGRVNYNFDQEEQKWKKKHSGVGILEFYIEKSVILLDQIREILSIEKQYFEEAKKIGMQEAQKQQAQFAEASRIYRERHEKVAELMGCSAQNDIKVRIIEGSKCESCYANGKKIEIKLTHRLFVHYSPEELIEHVQKIVPGACDEFIKYFLERQRMVIEKANWWQTPERKYFNDPEGIWGSGKSIDVYNRITDVFMINFSPSLNPLDEFDRQKMLKMKKTRKRFAKNCFIHSYEEPFIRNDWYSCTERIPGTTLLDVMGRYPPPVDKTELAKRAAEKAEAELREKKARKEIERLDNY